MARCGCASSECNCTVTAGDGITVTGNGNPGTPYVVSTDAGDAVTVSDTNSVNLTMVGNNITADVIRDPVAGNLLQIGPAGLSVPCEDVQDCVGQGFNLGLAYDDAANQFNARPSTDVGNIVTFGGDGGLYAAAGAFSCASLSTCPIDSLSDVDMTSDPPNTNELMVFDGVNWVPRPVGCGLTMSALGLNLDLTDFATFTRRTAGNNFDDNGTTPMLAGCNLEGMPIYCDTAGNLRTRPEKLVETNAATINQGFAPAETIPFTTTAISMVITNPSPCYAMCGIVYMAAILYESSTGNSNPETFFQFDLDDGSGFQEFGVRARDTRGISSVSQERTRFSAPLNVCLQPGQAKTIQFRVRWAQGPVAAGGSTQILAAARELRYVGTNI